VRVMGERRLDKKAKIKWGSNGNVIKKI